MMYQLAEKAYGLSARNNKIQYQDPMNFIFEQIKMTKDLTYVSTFWRVFAHFQNKRCTSEFISANQGGPMCRVSSRQSKNILFLKWVPRDDQQF